MSHDTLNILAIEDNPERQIILKEIYCLQNIVIADNVCDAIGHLQKKEFDLIHLDYDLLDNTNSLEAARQIRDKGRLQMVVIHSENPRGCKEIREIQPHAFTIPIDLFITGNPFSSRIKSILAGYSKDPILSLAKLFRWNAER